MKRIAFLAPPVLKPCEPGLSAAAAARALRGLGADAFAVDAGIGWHAHALSPRNLSAALQAAEAAGQAPLSFRRALRAAERPVPALRRPATYRDRGLYGSAAADLTAALRLAAVPFPGFRLGVGDAQWTGRRPQRSADLEEAARTPGPFDTYFLQDLLPCLERERVTHAAVSLTFFHQAFAVFRLAALLRDRLPRVRRLLGGPLPSCWAAAGAPLAGPAFRLFDEVRTGAPGELESLAMELGGAGTHAASGAGTHAASGAGTHAASGAGTHAASGAAGDVLAPILADFQWDLYLAPVPVVPAALGRGCYWRRCAFCPDHLHPVRTGCRPDAVAEFLGEVADRFPDGAMVHLTDSSLPPEALERVADEVKARRLPLRWHGFVRVEEPFTDPAFTRHLAEGGCAMLQWGIETASPRLLDLVEKGVPPDRARKALRACREAGIKNHAFLLFGMPTETEEDREETLEFVWREAGILGDLNASILNLPRGSPMHARPSEYGITEIVPFHRDADLALYDDFRCGASHPRLEARQWLGRRFLHDGAVKGILGGLNAPFKANHSCFLT